MRYAVLRGLVRSAMPEPAPFEIAEACSAGRQLELVLVHQFGFASGNTVAVAE